MKKLHLQLNESKKRKMMINRETATANLERLIGSGVIDEGLADTLEEIRFCIEAERAGLHLWGASDEDIQIIEAPKCLAADISIERLEAVKSKYSFRDAKGE